MAVLEKADFAEIKNMWLDEGKSAQEIADWFAVSLSCIYISLRKIHVSFEEFQEKETEIAEILQSCGNRRSIARKAFKRKVRLEKMYARQRNIE